MLGPLNTPQRRLLPSPGRKRIFMCLEPRERVWQLQIRHISVKRNLKIEANAVVSERTVHVAV